MKKLAVYSLLLCCIMFFVAGSAFAKPGADQDGPYVGNGMPSGPHVNLNIHGKDPAKFICPEKNTLGGDLGYWKQADDGSWKLDTSIFIPEYTSDDMCKENPEEPTSSLIPQTIHIQSGKEKGHPKKGGEPVTLPTDQIIVTDACTECITHENGDKDWAEFQLPPCDAGYKVYGRALGKPAAPGIRNIIISAGGLLTATDGNGFDLLELGEVINGEITPSTAPSVEATRKKGKPETMVLSDLFKFTGTICYLEKPESWDSEVLLCCTDLDDDGIYDVCVLKQDSEFDDNAVVDALDPCPVWKGPLYLGEDDGWVCYLDEDFSDSFTLGDTTVESEEKGNCSSLLVEAKTAYCKYYDNVWIFGIADLVEYYFGVVNDGVKLFQIRFYPIDPDCFTSSS